MVFIIALYYGFDNIFATEVEYAIKTCTIEHMVEQARATKKQQLLLEFVTSFIDDHDYGPSYREIMMALGYKSVSTVAVHVEALIAKGFLERHDNTARSLRVVDRNEVGVLSGTNADSVSQSLSKKIDTFLNDGRVEDVDILISALRLLDYGDVADLYATKRNRVEKNAKS